MCAQRTVSWLSLSPQKPIPSGLKFGSVVSPGANHATREKEVMDGRCTVPLGLQSHSAVRQCTGLGSPEALIPRDEESSWEETVPTKIPVAGDFLRAQPVRRGISQPAKPAWESPVQRSDWLPLREFSETGCMILPVRELAAVPQCSACEQLKASTRPST